MPRLTFEHRPGRTPSDGGMGRGRGKHGAVYQGCRVVRLQIECTHAYVQARVRGNEGRRGEGKYPMSAASVLIS